VRTISFNHDGQYIASASEDLFIDIVCYIYDYCCIILLQAISTIDLIYVELVQNFTSKNVPSFVIG